MIRKLLPGALLPLALLASLTACDAENQANEKEAIAAFAGNWAQEGGGEHGGMSVEIDGDSNKVHVHTAPDASGGHDHLDGTYEVDGTEITIRCNLGGSGDSEVWTGKIENDHLMLSFGDKTLKFHKGGSGLHDHDHGHDHGGEDHDGHDHDEHEHDHDEHK